MFILISKRRLLGSCFSFSSPGQSVPSECRERSLDSGNTKRVQFSFVQRLIKTSLLSVRFIPTIIGSTPITSSPVLDTPFTPSVLKSKLTASEEVSTIKDKLSLKLCPSLRLEPIPEVITTLCLTRIGITPTLSVRELTSPERSSSRVPRDTKTLIGTEPSEPTLRIRRS